MADNQEKELLISKTLTGKINQRSELVQDIISGKSGFLETWGLYLFGAFLLLTVISFSFIQYPDVVETNAVLKSENPPEEIISRQNGRLVKLFVHNGQRVTAGQVLGWIESKSSHQEVIALSGFLASSIHLVVQNNPGTISLVSGNRFVDLGELQAGYCQISMAFKKFKAHKCRPKKIRSSQLDNRVNEEQAAFLKALHSLQIQVDDWLNKYVVRAPANGIININAPLLQLQMVHDGSVLGYVIPTPREYYLEIYLAENNIGKVSAGMPVQLHFEAYPYQEHGFVEGKLDYVSAVSSDSGFRAIVTLNEGLRTNTRKMLSYKYGLHAQAKIITKNMLLSEHLCQSILKSLSSGKGKVN
jgi:multidrug resistance efflux pump